MKKTVRKMKLSGETIRTLGPPQLGWARGAQDGVSDRMTLCASQDCPTTNSDVVSCGNCPQPTTTVEESMTYCISVSGCGP